MEHRVIFMDNSFSVRPHVKYVMMIVTQMVVNVGKLETAD